MVINRDELEQGTTAQLQELLSVTLPPENVSLAECFNLKTAVP